MNLQAGESARAAVDAQTLGGVSMLLVAGLLALLYVYRSRSYILCWVSGWTLTALSMLLAAQDFKSNEAAYTVYGVSQFLAIVGALGFVLGADAYRATLRLRRGYALVLLPLLIWFALAPLGLKNPAAAFRPGHLLIAGALGAAGVGYFSLLPRARFLGAAVVGTTLLLIAGSNVWLLIRVPQAVDAAVDRATFVNLALYLIAALGMQLMTFEDMTYELGLANTRLKLAQEELRHMVTTDALTGCRNRRFFDDVIGPEIQHHRRYRIPLSLVFVDVDRFKAINDTLGHDSGDRVLRQVAAFLIRNVREADYVFRWGGDEFLILMSCPEGEAIRIATHLQVAFSGSADAKGLPAGVGLSIGCAEVPPRATDIMALVKVADDRMYVNKKRR